MEQRRRAGFKVAFVVVCICLFDRRRCICKYAFLCICNQRSQGGWLVLRWRPLKQCLILFVVLLITGIACTYIFAIFSLYCSCSRWRSAEEGNPWDGFFLFLAESSVDKVARFSETNTWRQHFQKRFFASTFSEKTIGFNIS